MEDKQDRREYGQEEWEGEQRGRVMDRRDDDGEGGWEIKRKGGT